MTSVVSRRDVLRTIAGGTLGIGFGWLGPDVGSAASATLLQPAPPVTAQAAFALDATAGVELYAANADAPYPPASTTKIVTALVVVRNVDDLDAPVTIEASDISAIQSDESSMQLVAGDVLTVNQLLYGLLLPSGNDAAVTLARFVGSVLLAKEGAGGDATARFVAEMNAEVERLKLPTTRFVNPRGIFDVEQVTTARELATLAREAMRQKVIARVVREREIEFTTVLKTYPLRSTNQLLGRRDGVHGVKTGHLPGYGVSLVAASWFGERNRVISVVLGSDVSYTGDNLIDEATDRRWSDTEALLDAAGRDFRWLSPTRPSDVPGLSDELHVWRVAMRDESAVVVPADRLDAFRYLLQLGPEAQPNAKVGRVLFFAGSDQIAERPVYQIS